MAARTRVYRIPVRGTRYHILLSILHYVYTYIYICTCICTCTRGNWTRWRYARTRRCERCHPLFISVPCSLGYVSTVLHLLLCCCDLFPCPVTNGDLSVHAGHTGTWYVIKRTTTSTYTAQGRERPPLKSFQPFVQSALVGLSHFSLQVPFGPGTREDVRSHFSSRYPWYPWDWRISSHFSSWVPLGPAELSHFSAQAPWGLRTAASKGRGICWSVIENP